MAGNIKGITIEFRGDTTKLDKALRQVNNETRAIDQELKNVDRALKFNPTSVELWRQKQQLLTQKISETKDKLDLLKKQQAAMDDANVDKQSLEYQKLQREIIETESKLKTFEGQLRKIGNVNLKALSMQLEEIGSKMTSVGQTMTTKVTAPIVAGYTLASKYASDYEENLNKIDVAFGDSAQSVKDWAETAKTEFGLSAVQATDAASAFGALGKGIGLSDEEAASMSTTLAGLSADLGSYFNVGVDESAKALEGIFTGESEALKKFGVVMTDTNLQQFAADQGLVWKEMSQAEKTALRYSYVLEKTKDAQGDFSRTSDGTANSLKIFQASLQDLGTAIGTNLLPIITPIIQKITQLVNKFNELSPQAQKIITIVGLVAAALGPVVVILGTLISSVGAIIGAIGVVVPAIAGVVAAFGPVILIIGAVIAAGVLLYKNWDTIKAKALQIKASIVATWNNIKTSVTKAVNTLKSSLSSAWNTIKSTASSAWNAVKNAIVSPIQAARDKVKSIISKVKSFFPIKVGNLLKGIKLPHFKISGSFSIKNKTVPTLSIDWYKTGGIFEGPQVIGVGEAGPEAVVPLDKLWEKLDKIAAVAMTGGNTFYITGDNPKQIAQEVKRILIQDVYREGLAWR